jgi:glycosyltransferase involved in cell wall biosynthesis
VLSWWQAVKGEYAPAQWETYRDAVGRGIRSANLVVAPSRTMLETARFFHGPFSNAEAIYNARDPACFQPGPKKNLILSVGRYWDEAKNMSALATVAPELPWPIHVAGEVKSPDGTNRAIEQLLPLGRLSPLELAPWFAQASIYALPAVYEPFGLSILEAALAGCALVLGDIPSLREIWGEAALFVPPRDPNALRAALQSLIDDRLHLKEMASRARERAFEFHPRRMAESYLTAYNRLMQSTANQDQKQELVPCES